MNAYQLRRIRLVNFHNFVDETVEIRDGGHLFLLGDNGSGKTTVLDAVHLVMSGGELELNAAARVGGRRDDGRTLQGVVLRYDFERGVRNAGGAIAYAAVELVERTTGRCLTVGVGAEATTMEARVAKWGFVINRALDEIALVDEESRPRDRDALRRHLGAAHVHTPLAAYRKELARRLFVSEAQYEEAVRFWGMAKAYREIVASARDFGGLFERLLPTPDGAVFDEILRTLRAIDDLDVALRDLDEQRGYVASLAERVQEVARGREAAARYHWLACSRERDDALVTAERETAQVAAWEREQERLGLESEAARLRCAGAEEILRRAADDDAAGVLRLVRDLEGRREAQAVDAARARRDAEQRGGEAARAAGIATAAHEDLARRARSAAATIRTAVDAVVELPGDLTAVLRVAAELDAVAREPGNGPPALPELGLAKQQLLALVEGRERAVLEARVHAKVMTADRDALQKRVSELEAQDPATPLAAGHRAARRALEAAGIEARAVYEILEPVPDADAAVLAAIESLVGETVLGALVAEPAQRDAARRLVADAAPEVRVVVEAGDTQLPAWCATAFTTSAETRGARAVLAAALCQPSGDEVSPPDGLDVRLRGLGHRVGERAPQLLGAEARRRALAARLEVARVARDAAEREVVIAAQAVETAQVALDRARRLERTLDEIVGGDVHTAWQTAALARQREQIATADARDAGARAAVHDERLVALDTELAVLRGRAGGVDLERLEARLNALRSQCERARGAWQELVGKRGQAELEGRQARGRGDAARARAAELEALTAEATRALRAAMVATGANALEGDDAALAHHVKVTLRGDSFRSLETLQQRIAEERRAADAAADELERDGSRGVRNLVHAARFGFGYDRAANVVEDRRGQPLAGVLAEIDRSIAEQRSVVNERTRTLMDTLVMGELARHLQGQVHRLGDTMKGINRVLRGLRFGPTEYQFQVTPRKDREELVELVRRLSILDDDSRRQFRSWIDGHLDELRGAEEGIPALLDYRRWFEFKLRMSTTDAEGVELTHRLRQVGSGGEQGVPNYLLVLALAKLMFDAAGAGVRPLLFDEAFYGIDAGRRDQLLHLATELGLQLLVASPDQDGATSAVRAATTLFVVKDAEHDIHLAPYHYWRRVSGDQTDLFAAPPPPPEEASCRT
jgi:hypothetical protein